MAVAVAVAVAWRPSRGRTPFRTSTTSWRASHRFDGAAVTVLVTLSVRVKFLVVVVVWDTVL